MSEEQKKDECCSTNPASGCGCCCKMKKVVLGVILVLGIFMLGYAVGKGCLFSGACAQKMCPLPQH